MCPSGAYRDLILRQAEELCRRYPVDGFWCDLTYGPTGYCQQCRQAMSAEGVDFKEETHDLPMWQQHRQPVRAKGLLVQQQPDREYHRRYSQRKPART